MAELEKCVAVRPVIQGKRQYGGEGTSKKYMWSKKMKKNIYIHTHTHVETIYTQKAAQYKVSASVCGLN